MTPDRQEFLEAVLKAHDTAARNNANVSSAAYQNTLLGSGRIENAIVSGLLSIGGGHAPFEAARRVFECYQKVDVEVTANLGQKIPGFGNSFFKNRYDPAWLPVVNLVREKFPTKNERILQLTQWVFETTHRQILPNAALYTAAFCVECQIPRGKESLIFLLARLPAWVQS